MPSKYFRIKDPEVSGGRSSRSSRQKYSATAAMYTLWLFLEPIFNWRLEFGIRTITLVRNRLVVAEHMRKSDPKRSELAETDPDRAGFGPAEPTVSPSLGRRRNANRRWWPLREKIGQAMPPERLQDGGIRSGRNRARERDEFAESISLA